MAIIDFPKSMLKQIKRKIDINSVIQVSHTGRIDEMDRSEVDEILKLFVKKYGKFQDIEMVRVNIKRHNATGKRSKYSMSGTLAVKGRDISGKSAGWGPAEAAHGLTVAFRKQILRERAKKRSGTRRTTRELRGK